MKEIPIGDMVWTKHPPDPVGGQHVGTGGNGVRLVHTPTEITIDVNLPGNSQLNNRQVAYDALLGALTSPAFRD